MESWACAGGAMAGTAGAAAMVNPSMTCCARIVISLCPRRPDWAVSDPTAIPGTRRPALACPALANAGRLRRKFALLIGERPDPELLLADLPQPGEARRLGDQEENDQRSDDHELQMLDGRGADREAEEFRRRPEHHRQAPEEDRAQGGTGILRPHDPRRDR